MRGNSFCHNCGSSTHEEAIICINCGVGLKKGKSIDSSNLVEAWSKFSYSNYILILLFSLMPFINIKCVGDKVESITGLNMAIGAERKYLEKEKYYNIYGYFDERYVTKKESLFSWDICLFYITIIITLFVLLSSKIGKFKIAKNLTILALILLVEWFIVISIRINKVTGRAIEFSWGSGFWLTLILTIVSLILISIYLKKQRLSHEFADDVYPSPSNKMAVAENINASKRELQGEEALEAELINYQPVSLSNSISDDKTQEKPSKLKGVYVVSALVIFFFGLGIFYLLKREELSFEQKKLQNQNSVVAPKTSNEQAAEPDNSTITTNLISDNKKYWVLAEKAYFYSEPNLNTKRQAYLVRGQQLEGCCEQNGFLNCTYVNDKGQITQGWLYTTNLSETEIITTFYEGTKIYCDEYKYWYLKVTINTSKITIETYPGENNSYHQNKDTPKSVEKGFIKNSRIFISDERETLEYKLENGILFQLNNEGGYSEYRECD
ncbi:MAG TPA: hypothetical protein DCQ29_01205 [Chitinophagaceae bacterium]|nr:hypothetical protein [Chitinophagaceae bacterium]